MEFSHINFAGRDFVLHNVEGADQVSEAMQHGIYETPLPIMIMATAMRHPGLVLDVGANNGLYSVLTSIVHPAVTVLAFEPYPVVQRILRLNIEANRLAERIEVRPYALSDANGTSTLYLPDPAHGLLETSCSLEPGFKPWHQSMEIDIKRLDDVVLPSPVRVMKVDIEGHEHAFLDGAVATIARDRPFIFIEVLDIAAPTAEKLTRFVHQHDYLDFRLRPDIVIHSPDVTFDPAAWNHAFVPRDRLGVFMDACEASNLEVLMPWREPPPDAEPVATVGLREELRRNVSNLYGTIRKVAVRLVARQR